MERQTLNSGRENSFCKTNLSLNNKDGIVRSQTHFAFLLCVAERKMSLFGTDTEQTLLEINEGGQLGKDQRKNQQHHVFLSR